MSHGTARVGESRTKTSGLAGVGNTHRPVTTDGLEVEKEQQVDRSHGRRDERVGLESLTVTLNARFYDHLLFSGLVGSGLSG